MSRQDGEPDVCWWKLGAGVLWSILMAFRSLGIKVERKMSPDRCLDTNPSLDERSHCVPTPYYGTSALYEGWVNDIKSGWVIQQDTGEPQEPNMLINKIVKLKKRRGR